MNVNTDMPEAQPAAGFTPAAGKLARQVMAQAAHHTPNPEQAQAGAETMAARLWDVYRAHYDTPTPWEELGPADRLPWIAVAEYAVADTLQAMLRVTAQQPQAQPQQPGRPNRRARRAAAKEQRKRGRK